MKSRTRNAVVYFAGSVASVAATALPALAVDATEFTVPTINMGPVYGLGTAVLASLAIIWVLRKLIKTSNRS